MPGPTCRSLAAARPRWLDKRPSAATGCCPDGSIAEPWGPPRGLTRQPCTGRRLRRNTTCHRPRQLRLPPNVQKHESIADGAQHLPAWRSHERNPAGHEDRSWGVELAASAPLRRAEGWRLKPALTLLVQEVIRQCWKPTTRSPCPWASKQLNPQVGSLRRSRI